jgi:hypothetical protein
MVPSSSNHYNFMTIGLNWAVANALSNSTIVHITHCKQKVWRRGRDSNPRYRC